MLSYSILIINTYFNIKTTFYVFTSALILACSGKKQKNSPWSSNYKSLETADPVTSGNSSVRK